MQIGEIRKNKYGQKQVWHACEGCGKERWVCVPLGKLAYVRCVSCAHKGLIRSHEVNLRASAARKGKRHHSRTNGRVRDGCGYIRIRLPSNAFFFPMATKAGYVQEHRLVMARFLGRLLQPWEVVHHKDGIRDHNDLENLELTTQGAHALETRNSIDVAYKQGFRDGQRLQDDELRKEIRLLRWQLTELVNERQLLK